MLMVMSCKSFLLASSTDSLPSAMTPVFIGLISTMAGLAWLLLGLWSASPDGRYLNPGFTQGFFSEVGQGLPGDRGLLSLVGHAGLWVLMCVAMMLPTTLPLLVIWRRLVSRHRDRLLLLGLVIAGYLSVWLGFGLIAHGADAGLHQLIRASSWSSSHRWMLGVATFGLAGLFQFSPLKNYCLERCRSPLGMVMAAWQGEGLRRQAWLLGINHGLFCLGCCWALMLLMFVVGMGNLGWMLLLGAVMALEKNVSWGDRLSVAFGVVLLVGAIAIAASNLNSV